MSNTSISRLGRPELLLLRAVHDYDYLTAEQATRLLFSKGSHTYAQAKLKGLAEGGYLVRIEMPHQERYGTAPYVYAVSGKGRRLLQQLGVEVVPYRRPSEEREHSYLFLVHSLAVVDVLIAASLVNRDEPRMRLVSFRGERALKRIPVLVRLPDGKQMKVAPDAWMEFRTAGRYQNCLVLELDRGTEEQAQWRRKVASLLAYTSGPYEQAFGTDVITVIVVTTAGERRLRNLIDWTGRELAQLAREADAALFSFTSNPPTGDPAEFFLGDHWREPLSEVPYPPLGLESEGHG